MREMSRIAEIAAVFEAVVLFDGGSIDEPRGITCILQAVDEPVPVEGGFHGNGIDRPAGSQRFDDHAQIVRQAFAIDLPVIRIQYHNDAVV